mmetsp:Transcript_4562/g.11256  ORF Transcript_4562/g.11256 Transcript_4562/m.11256 type:complete len:130 (+) Transcript_4562:280-669(+)
MGPKKGRGNGQQQPSTTMAPVSETPLPAAASGQAAAAVAAAVAASSASAAPALPSPLCWLGEGKGADLGAGYARKGYRVTVVTLGVGRRQQGVEGLGNVRGRQSARRALVQQNHSCLRLASDESHSFQK